MSDAPAKKPEAAPTVEPVTRKTLIATALDTRPDAGRVLREAFGLPCEECPVAETETVEEGAGYYGHDADEIVRRLNACALAPPLPAAADPTDAGSATPKPEVSGPPG